MHLPENQIVSGGFFLLIIKFGKYNNLYYLCRRNQSGTGLNKHLDH